MVLVQQETIGRKPNAQSEEGATMRVHSTFAVNTHQQQNPFISQDAGLASAGRTHSEYSFAEHLKLQFQQAGAEKMTNSTVSLAAGLYWGFYPTLKELIKPEPTHESNAS